VGLERPGWSEGQDRVALLDREVQPAQEAVSDAVAAAQDDPPPPRPKHEEAPQLPEAGPPSPPFLAATAGPGGQQADQQAIDKGWNPEGENRGGVHAHRAGQQRPAVPWPGLGGVLPGAGQAQQHPEHVHQPDRQVLVGAEEDGGYLTDQPDQATGGEQKRRYQQPEGVGDVLVVAVGVAVMPHWRHLPAAGALRGAGRGTRSGRWRSGAGRRRCGCGRCDARGPDRRLPRVGAPGACGAGRGRGSVRPGPGPGGAGDRTGGRRPAGRPCSRWRAGRG
jgi:hypothetical protein